MPSSHFADGSVSKAPAGADAGCGGEKVALGSGGLSRAGEAKSRVAHETAAARAPRAQSSLAHTRQDGCSKKNGQRSAGNVCAENFDSVFVRIIFGAAVPRVGLLAVRDSGLLD